MSKQKKNETKIVEELNEEIKAESSKLSGQRDKYAAIDEQIPDDMKDDVIGVIENNEAEIQNEDTLVTETFEDIKSKAEEEIEAVSSIVHDDMHVDATVIPSKLNMRKNPSMMGRIIAVLSRGEHVTIDFTVPEVNGFVSVRYKALTGYIMKQYLDY